MFAERPQEQITMVMTTALPDYHLLRPNAVAIPLMLRAVAKSKAKKDDGNGEFGSILHEAAPAYHVGKITANLSPAARAYLAENADGIRQDWPRIPLPDSRAVLLASAELGTQVAALLDTETPVQSVTVGKIRPELVKIAVVTRLNEKLNLSLTAGWGHAGQGGVTMPGKGKLETRPFTAEEVGQASSLSSSSQPDRQDACPTTILGSVTHDVFLNEAACWQNVPEKVWDYTIGGYQVIKKWLSYREFDLLGRALTPDEAREVTHMARRIAALILLQPDLDRNYQAVKAATVAL